MIRLALKSAPVEVPLTGHLTGVTLTIRRLPSNEFAMAQKAAMSWLRDKARVAEFLERHDLLPPDAAGLIKVQADPVFMAGLGVLIASIECGARAIVGWSGLTDDEGEPIEASAKAFAPPTEAGEPLTTARLALEMLYQDEHFQRQVDDKISELARVVVVEGKPFGGAPNGSSADGTTASPPTTAETAARSATPAPTAGAASTDGSAPKSSTRRRRRKAPLSGD